MQYQTDNYSIKMLDEPTYTFGSVDNINSYEQEYVLTDGSDTVTSKHGIVVGSASAVLGASGGCSTVHKNSLVIVRAHCIIAVGNSVCCLSLPRLGFEWHIKIDPATCFGLHYSQKHDCIISHGELLITCLSLNGDIQWSVGGKDIFSESLSLYEDHIKAIDFNKEQYTIDIETGKKF
jgi:hypothetical protein